MVSIVTLKTLLYDLQTPYQSKKKRPVVVIVKVQLLQKWSNSYMSLISRF